MFQGIGVMASVAVICMLVVLVAMVVDFISGWRKAKQRGEARTSYGISRSFTKFLMYEGILFITCGIDALVHFAWWQFSDTTYMVPLVTILGAVVLCVVEIMSVREKADEKTRNRIDSALQSIIAAVGKDKAIEVVTELVKKANERKEARDEDPA